MIACFWLPELAIACERARRGDLTNKPLVLIQDEQVVCLSVEAAAFGITSGASRSGARSLCPAAAVLPYDHAAYQEAAQSAWDELAQESSFVEPNSPELCFMGIDAQIAFERSLYLKHRLRKIVGCPVFVGIAASKFVADHAARRQAAQPVVVDGGAECRFLAGLSLEFVPSVERLVRERFAKLGITTFGELLSVPVERLPRALQEVGRRLRLLGQGSDFDPVRPLWPLPTIQHEVRFEEPVSVEAQVVQAVLLLADRAAADLISRVVFCRSLIVSLRFENESIQQAAERLRAPTTQASEISDALRRLISRLKIAGPVSGICLTLTGLGPGQSKQPALFDQDSLQCFPDGQKERVTSVSEAVKHRCGPESLLVTERLAEPTQRSLVAYSLGHLVGEPVRVITDPAGTPTRYERSVGHYTRSVLILAVQNRWKERSWEWGEVKDITIFRVYSERDGLVELHQTDRAWLLAAVAD